MNISEEKYDLIQKYLEEKLSLEEKIAFEQQLETDAELAEEVQLHQLVNEYSFEKGLVEIWEKVGQDLSQKPPSFPYKKTIIIVIAAFILATPIVYFTFTAKKEKQVSLSSETLSSRKEDIFDLESESKTNDTEVKDNKVKENNLIADHAIKRNNIDDPALKKDQVIFKTDSSSEIKIPAVSDKDKFQETKPLLDSDPHVIPNKTCPEITFNVRTEPACMNDDNGSIQIIVSGIKGGEKPYSYSIGGNELHSQSYSNHLAKGNYSVLVIDNRGCVGEKLTEVSEKRCIQYKDYTLNLNQDTWKIPLSSEESGSISITDQAGRIIYKKKINYGAQEEWDGKSLTGEVLEMGTYYYIVELDKGEIRQGYITIVY